MWSYLKVFHFHGDISHGICSLSCNGHGIFLEERGLIIGDRTEYFGISIKRTKTLSTFTLLSM